jgi:hypothetical protein
VTLFLAEFGVPRRGVDAERARDEAVDITLSRFRLLASQILVSSVSVMSFMAKLFAAVPSVICTALVADLSPPRSFDEEESLTAPPDTLSN